MPVRKDDEVRVTRGPKKGTSGKVTACYRKKWVIHVQGLTRSKVNGQVVNLGIDASKVEIIKLHQDNNRKKMLERRAQGQGEADKGKFTEDAIEGK
eukprot:TRINITY_DN42170_c0_g1_i1.p1 TRINITY_DN42170_c0_g1~~TRINITY_DN42170_c0_g1_i1.p1  ORF type:complete len:108 (+),score=16.18 TRINITY_DN42170_c0_g1_i1:39-326(+)